MVQLLKFKLLVLTAILALMLSVLSCSDHNGEEPVLPTPRTVLVYMAANCNLGLEGYDELDIEEMSQAVKRGDIGRGRLIVYHAAYLKEPVLKEITPEGVVPLKTYDIPVSSLEVERMQEVIADTKSFAPAETYGIVFWSHGTSWKETSSSRSGGDQPVGEPLGDQAENRAWSRSYLPGDPSLPPVTYSYGMDNGVEMKITSLAKALEGNWFEFIYFDVCHMATVEVAYELRHFAPVLVGSTTELYVLGMPYHHNLKPMFEKTPDMVTAASNTLQYYIDHPKYGCVMSVLNLTAMDRLAAATKAVYESGVEIPSYYDPVPYDRLSRPCLVYDYGHYIRGLEPQEELLAEWESAYSEVVIYKGATDVCYFFDMSKFTGMGSFILKTPQDARTYGYYNQSWYKDVARYAIDEQ